MSIFLVSLGIGVALDAAFLVWLLVRLAVKR